MYPGRLVRAEGGEGPVRVVFDRVEGGSRRGVEGVGRAGVVFELPDRLVGGSIVY